MRKLRAKGPDQGGRADQIADIVAAYNQDAGFFFQSVQGKDPTPVTDEKKPLF